MSDVNDHFITVDNWEQAEETLGFKLFRPRHRPQAFRIHVRDHRLRDVPPTLEVYFDGFTLSQAKRDEVEARRLASESYGLEPTVVRVGPNQAVAYELGPEPDPGDIDPRPPSVVTWADGDLFLLLGSDTKPADDLLEIAASLYPAR